MTKWKLTKKKCPWKCHTSLIISHQHNTEKLKQFVFFSTRLLRFPIEMYPKIYRTRCRKSREWITVLFPLRRDHAHFRNNYTHFDHLVVFPDSMARDAKTFFESFDITFIIYNSKSKHLLHCVKTFLSTDRSTTSVTYLFELYFCCRWNIIGW